MSFRLLSLFMLGLLLVACGSDSETAEEGAATNIPAATTASESSSPPEPTNVPAATTAPDPTDAPEPATESETSSEPTTAPESSNEDEATSGALLSFMMEAWADNWFAAYLGDVLIVEDSVSITTERSFNAETVTFSGSYPLHLNFILKDFKENDTGLEYIGVRNQQMGDGGFIMQLTELESGTVVAVSNIDWACIVIHEAPLDKSCEDESNPTVGTAPCDFTEQSEPEGWQAADFDDSNWNATNVYTAAAVGPKDGYDQISWDPSAELIWGPDLETNNTLLCRVTVTE